jgi:hypothetical protein
MNVSELDDAISAALMALSAAQLTLRKGASPRELDILRKAHLGDDPSTRVIKSGDELMKSARASLDDLMARMDKLEAQTRKTAAQS